LKGGKRFNCNSLRIIMDTLSVLIAIISVVIAIISVYRVGKIEKELVSQVEGVGESLRIHIDTELEPLIKKVNKAFGFKALESHDSRALKKAEGLIIQDVLDTQDPLLMGLLDMISPATKEYLEENPSLIVDLIPRLQALSQIEGFSILDLLKPSGTGSDNRKHPYGFREE